MTVTIEKLASYLGKEASFFLADDPFKKWSFKRTLENDLDQPLIDYVFARDGMDFVCDERDRLRSIFLYSDKSRCFSEQVEDLPLTSNRQEVVARLGLPTKSGQRLSDPILGEYGPWDRFSRSGYAVHVEYRLDADIINKVTVMRADVVP
jgi:hypothetical protein